MARADAGAGRSSFRLLLSLTISEAMRTRHSATAKAPDCLILPIALQSNCSVLVVEIDACQITSSIVTPHPPLWRRYRLPIAANTRKSVSSFRGTVRVHVNSVILLQGSLVPAYFLRPCPCRKRLYTNYLPLEVCLGQAYHTLLVPIVFLQVTLVALDSPTQAI